MVYDVDVDVPAAQMYRYFSSVGYWEDLVEFYRGNGSRTEIAQYVDVFRGNIIDVSSDSMIVEITGDPDKIDAFVRLMQPYGIKELARTGVTAMHRGQKSVRDSVK